MKSFTLVREPSKGVGLLIASSLEFDVISVSSEGIGGVGGSVPGGVLYCSCSDSGLRGPYSSSNSRSNSKGSGGLN